MPPDPLRFPETVMAIRVSADIGGTFTDLQFLNTASGALHEYKTPSTPADPAEGLFRGINEASGQFSFSIADVELVLHGTTIATNAVLERKMAPGALLTTAGFEDVLEIGRHMRKDVYGLHAERRSLLVKRSDRFGVVERIDAKGNIVMPLDEAKVEEVAREIARRKIPVVAIGFLDAFRNPAHEIQAREVFFGGAPELIVSISSEISPETREYERFSTTVLNDVERPALTRRGASGLAAIVGRQARRPDAVHGADFVVERRVARNTNRAEYLAFGVTHQHAARHRHHAAAGHVGERVEELRHGGSAARQFTAAKTQAQRAPGLAGGDLGA